MIYGCTIALTLAGLLFCPAQNTDKEKDKEAELRTKTFEKEFNQAKTVQERIKAVEGMAEIQHPKILGVLARLLDGFGNEVSAAVAIELGKYGKSKEAAEALTRTIKAKIKDRDLVRTFFKALGKIRYEPSAKFVHDYMRVQDAEIAAAAVDACAAIRSKDSIDKLIPFLAELEGKDIKIKQLPPRDFTKPPTPEEQMQELERQWVAAVLPAVQGALAAITNQKHGKATDWVMWWRKNKATFKVED